MWWGRQRWRTTGCNSLLIPCISHLCWAVSTWTVHRRVTSSGYWPACSYQCCLNSFFGSDWKWSVYWDNCWFLCCAGSLCGTGSVDWLFWIDGILFLFADLFWDANAKQLKVHVFVCVCVFSSKYYILRKVYVVIWNYMNISCMSVYTPFQ